VWVRSKMLFQKHYWDVRVIACDVPCDEADKNHPRSLSGKQTLEASGMNYVVWGCLGVQHPPMAINRLLQSTIA